MYERLLDKNATPDATIIQEHLGLQSCERLAVFESRLKEAYHLVRELRVDFL